jgi:O-antigen ligase
MFIPATVYYAKKLKIGFPFILIAIFQVAMLLLTASRGGILAFAVIAIPLLIFLIFSKNWIQSFVSILVTVMGIFVIGWINWDWFVALYERFQRVMLDDSGRWEIYREALAVFLDHPLFGGGLFARIDGNNVYHMYHNTFLHTLATLGILGFLGLLWQLWVQFSLLFRQKTAAMVILIISLSGAHLHGMLDNIYYMPQFMVLMLIMVSVVEKSNLLKESVPAELH